MKKRNILLVICLLTAGTLSLMAAAQQEQKILSEKLVRLHVVAHSDTESDQAEKLLVRDAVLAVTEPLTQQADPRLALSSSLPEIQEAAEACLQSLGSPHPVKVTLCRERFPTRCYENFALPAGSYPALRVTIGEGNGKNWWCVAFPSICFRASAADLEEAAVSAGFTQKEISLITEENGGYVLKFKFFELLDEIKSRIFA